MWLKLLLLTLYILFLFLLSRLLDAAALYNDTGTFLTSFVALDPITLSVKKLKELLDDRGVSYVGAVEKQELVELVQASGSPTREEVVEDLSSTQLPAESTQFTCGSHFYEEVEDTKDSAWLVQVVMDNDDPPILSEKIWKEVRMKAAKFGIRTGVFKCSLDNRLCTRKGWTSARVILALPRGHKAKEDVVLHTYMLPSTSAAVVQWLRKHLSSRVKVIKTNSDLMQWTTYSDNSKKTELRVILFSLLKTCPMFLSALAIKFNGRVKFGMVDTSSCNSCKKLVNSQDLPVYMVVTPEKTVVYGRRKGESFNYKSMELFLRTLIPEMNDVFLWSLIIVNALAGFELFFMYSYMWVHFLLYVGCVVKYNSILFLTWLMILGLYHFPFMQTCTDFSLKCLRLVSGSDVASILRSDYKSFYSHTFLLVTFIVFASITGFLWRKLKRGEVEETSSFFSNWWHVPGDNLLSTYFFRPMVSLTRPVASQELDLEEGMELLIERLAVPTLWLQPVISMDYIKDLPVWKYRGWCEADDATERAVFCSSDEEMPPPMPPMPLTEVLATPSSSHPECSKAHSSAKAEPLIPFQPKLLSQPRKPEADRAPPGMLEFRECSICLENYCYSEVLCGLPCGHNFHITCIMSWLTRDNHCCPICRWPSYKAKNGDPHLHCQ